MSMKNSNDTSWDRTRDLPICSTSTLTTVLPQSPFPGVVHTIIPGQISKSGTRTPPREYYVWWPQETLNVYRLDDKKDN